MLGYAKLARRPGTIGAYFNIGYGQKSLHSKDTLTPGISPVVSSSGTDNGCYGFFDFDEVIAPALRHDSEHWEYW